MANRRFEMHEYRHVLSRLRLGESSRAIARAGLMGRRKVEALREAARQRGWLDPADPLPDDGVLAEALRRPSSRPQTESQVEPFGAQVTQWWRQGIRGKRIHQALVENHGFTNSYSSVRRFLQHLQVREPRVTTVMEFDPGEAAQIDFGRGPTVTDTHTGETFRTWVFVMVLAWSRHQYAEIVRDQKIETWLGCHRRAFEWFGGVPARLIIDNLGSAITRACYYDPAAQRSYEDCAEGYGFRISPCPVADPQKKGRVESGVKYIKSSFLPLRDFSRGLVDANNQLCAWVMGEAGNRIHGTTHELPLTRFVDTERAFLRPLPAIPPQLAAWAKVKLHSDCHVKFEKGFYSAPWKLVHKSLWLRATETTVQLYHEHEMVATHPRLSRPGARHTVEGHLPPNDLAYRMRTPQWCLQKARAVGPACHALIEVLFADRVMDRLRAAQGIIRLGERYGHSRLEAACERALAYDDPRYRTVKHILDKGLDLQTELMPARAPLPGAYTGNGRFCRDTTTLFT